MCVNWEHRPSYKKENGPSGSSCIFLPSSGGAAEAWKDQTVTRRPMCLAEEGGLRRWPLYQKEGKDLTVALNFVRKILLSHISNFKVGVRRISSTETCLYVYWAMVFHVSLSYFLSSSCGPEDKKKIHILKKLLERVMESKGEKERSSIC